MTDPSRTESKRTTRLNFKGRQHLSEMHSLSELWRKEHEDERTHTLEELSRVLTTTKGNH